MVSLQSGDATPSALETYGPIISCRDAGYAPGKTGSHDCVGCPYATPAERKRTLRAFDGRLVVDLEYKRVTWDAVQHHFSPSQILMLAAFANRPGRVISIDHLLMAIYGYDEPDSGAVILKIQISKVGQAFRANGVPLQFTNVLDEGYAMELIGEAAS